MAEGRPRPALRRLQRVALLVLLLATLGEAGHVLLQRWGAHLAHHAFHVAFGVGAFLAFAGYVLLDLRRHGAPRFSWRIRR